MKLNKLKLLGIKILSDAALYMPTSFEDYRFPIANFDVTRLSIGCEYTFKCKLYSEPSTKFKSGRPYTAFTVTDGALLLQFTLFGDTRADVDELKTKTHFYVRGSLSVSGNGYFINNAGIVEESNIGKILPVYPGVTGKVKSATVNRLLANHIAEAIPAAAIQLRELLYKRFSTNSRLRDYIQCHRLTLTDVLSEIHKPTSIESAYEALEIMRKIAVISAADTLIDKAMEANEGRYTEPVHGWSLEKLSANIPFELTNEQVAIVQRQIAALAMGKVLNLLLIGDVGTGKTIVFGTIAAYLCSAGKRACVMVPNSRLAEQIHSELTLYFPVLKPLLVTADSVSTQEQMQNSLLLVGTSALLHRAVGEFSLVIIDEQQKLSSAQRSQLVGSNTSIIEASATPIPRTLALAKYGAVTIEYIKQCHAQKSIESRIVQREGSDQLLTEIIGTVDRGGKVLVVCPKREAGNDDLQDAESVYVALNEQLPSLVCLAHSGLTESENSGAIEAIKSGRKSVLVSTVIVEVGMTIPKLELVIVMHAERFGLTQLHQLRGRLVREGGSGLFILYLPKELKMQKSISRMQALCEISDGYELAKEDLRLRGVGDISDGSTQHGSYQGHVRNLNVELDELEQAIDFFSGEERTVKIVNSLSNQNRHA